MFPGRLFRMMDDIETRQKHLSHIVSWHHKNDLAFVIHKPDEFVREVMPIYFQGQSKLSSFKRQLKNYGFKRHRERLKEVEAVYFHENFAFSRKKPLLLKNVVLKCHHPTKNTALIRSLLLQTATISCSPQETARAPAYFHSMDTTTKPLPLDNLDDEILREAATKLLWSHEEAPGEDLCLDTKKASRKRIRFPEHLFHMMQDIETRQKHLSHIVSWHHKIDVAFVIHKPDEFVREVMPIYFQGQSKLSSFKRQLKNYGFKRHRERLKEVGVVYFHENFAFSRKKPLLLENIVLKAPFPTKNTVLTNSMLLQMTMPCFPQETAQTPAYFHSMDTTTKPLPLDNPGDEILGEAATELLWSHEEAPGEDCCLDNDFDCQASLSRLAVQQWDPGVGSLGSTEESIYMRAFLRI